MDATKGQAPGSRRDDSGSRPLFGNQLRSALEVVGELRERRHGRIPVEEPAPRPLFGNQIREARSVLAELRERRRAAKAIARGD